MEVLPFYYFYVKNFIKAKCFLLAVTECITIFEDIWKKLKVCNDFAFMYLLFMKSRLLYIFDA